MDARKTKRPRTPGSASDTPVKKKSKSNKNKNKSRQKSSSTASANSSAGPDTNTTKKTKTKSSLDETATADGQMMAQILSTFSRAELGRFEAFQRSSLSHTVVQDWIATCLVHRLDKLTKEQRKLPDLVVPGHAPDIGIAVATAGKVYAQRLAAAALQYQREHGSQPTALTPASVWHTVRERQATGLDPGFYMQPQGMEDDLTVGSTSYQRQRLAALEAQDIYDKANGRTEETADDGEDPKKADNPTEDTDMKE